MCCTLKNGQANFTNFLRFWRKLHHFEEIIIELSCLGDINFAFNDKKLILYQLLFIAKKLLKNNIYLVFLQIKKIIKQFYRITSHCIKRHILSVKI